MIRTDIVNLQVNAVKPIAYLKDIGGLRLIVEILDLERGERFAFLEPPTYSVKKLIPLDQVRASIIKHDYDPIEETVLLRNDNEIKNFTDVISSSNQ